MTSLLHINDNQLRLQKNNGQVVSSQGYAWFNGESVVFDINSEEVTAVQQCRLHPQLINNRYWQQCDQSSISANSLGLRHSADLIWQQLSQLKMAHQLQELILFIPSHYQESQLQLLLGVAKACDLSVLALVNKAVAELSRHALADGEYLHIDVQLHQTVCATVAVESGEYTLVDVQILQDVGIHLMQEALLHGLQNIFIQDDRFDPLHDAATEQQLFNQLPTIAMSLSVSGNVNIGVEHQSRLHNISLEAATWAQMLVPFKERIQSLSKPHKGIVKKAYIDLNNAFGTASLSGLNKSVFTTVDSNDIDEPKRFLNNHKDGDAVLYQTQLSTSVTELSTAQENHDKSVENNTFTTSTLIQGPTHIALSGSAVDLNQAYIEHSEHGLKILKKTQGNLVQLLQDKKLFIINDEARIHLKVNDRIGSYLADGVLTVIQVL